MPFVPERCPVEGCGRNLHGITTTEGPKFRCGYCQKVFTQEEIMLDQYKETHKLPSGLVSDGRPKKKPSP